MTRQKETRNSLSNERPAAQITCDEHNCSCNTIPRRTFLKSASTAATVLGGLEYVQRTFAQPVSRVDHFVPEDKQLTRAWLDLLTAKGERKVYRGEKLHTIGMPCGGVAAGQLYVLGDGSLGCWWIANNAHNTGYGHHYEIETPLGDYPVTYTPDPFTPPTPVDQGFALRVDGRVWQLNQEGFADIGFIGEYPIAQINYEGARGDATPVAVSAEVFSPFIPLNTRDSATPCTTLRYTVTNTSDQTQEVSIGGWLQNPVMLTHRGIWQADHRNQVVKSDGWVGVTMDCIEHVVSENQSKPKVEVFEDFENGYENWTIEGQAFGDKPAAGTIEKQQPVSKFQGERLVNTYCGGSDRLVGKATSRVFTIELPYIWFLVGGGSHTDTAIRLVIDGKVVHTTSGQNQEALRTAYWDVKKLIGKRAQIEIIDNNRESWGHINVDQIVFADRRPKLAKTFDLQHQYMGQVTLSALDDHGAACASYDSKQIFLEAFEASGRLESRSKATYPLGVSRVAGVASQASLRPGESRTFDFVIGWYFPNRMSDDQPLHGVGWGVATGQGHRKVGNRYNNWYGHCNEVVDYVQREYTRLTDETYLFRDTLYDTSLPYWLIQRLSMPLANLASETVTWREDGFFWAWEGVGCCVGNCGHVWNYAQGVARLFPELERSVRIHQDFFVGRGYNEDTGVIYHRGYPQLGWAADGMGGYIIKAYREHLCSSDDSFLRGIYPKVKKSIEFLIGQDGLDGKVDGFLEGRQHNTYDIDYYGANTLVGAMYHAALRAGAKMAKLMDDDEFASHCTQLAGQGANSTMNRIWKEEWGYFVQDVDLAKHPEKQQGDGCLSDQLFGQSLAHQVGLGHLYPENAIKKTVASIWKYNWAPDIAPQSEAHPPERWYCRPGEAGLFMCTWPKTKHLGPKSVRYRDEIWTGTEYQVATHMFYEGMVTEPLAIIRAIHERYDGVKHNPWNEIECGDHYARALASWGCLLGISGFEYDGPAGHIGFAPKLQPEEFKCFFSAAEGWGTFEQSKESKALTAKLSVAYGKILLSTIAFSLPRELEISRVLVNGQPAASSRSMDRLLVELGEATQLKAGDMLTLHVS